MWQRHLSKIAANDKAHTMSEGWNARILNCAGMWTLPFWLELGIPVGFLKFPLYERFGSHLNRSNEIKRGPIQNTIPFLLQLPRRDRGASLDEASQATRVTNANNISESET
jgi:hypothetical protein